MNGKPLPLPVSPSGGVRRLRSLGVGFVPEDRKEEGLFLGLPISYNIAIELHSASGALAVAKGYRKVVSDIMSSLNVRATGASMVVSALSGGNQQKVLLGRYLAAELDVLIVEEPTRGVDVGAKSEIYKLLRDFAARGGAVLILSRETVEMIGLCDRLYVIHGNTVVAEMPAENATEHVILDAALSA